MVLMVLIKKNWVGNNKKGFYGEILGYIMEVELKTDASQTERKKRV